MSVPSMEDLVETFVATHPVFRDRNAIVERALRAVLDRLKPVVADGARQGWWHGREYHGTHLGATCDRDVEGIAARIIDRIKGA